MNSFGRILRFTTFGESHGRGIGGILDGFPAGFQLDIAAIQAFLDKRRPNLSKIVSQRNESDEVNFLSGLLDGNTSTGAPIAFFIANRDAQSKDYEALKEVFRPSHADYTYFAKYGLSPQPGGGRASARETVARCVAGAISLQWLESKGIRIYPFVKRIGKIALSEKELVKDSYQNAYSFETRCPDSEKGKAIKESVLQAAQEGNSLGGIVSCIIEGVPAGVGEPIYDKLSARLAYAMLSVNAVKAFEIGDGFALATMCGSEANDGMRMEKDNEVIFESNHSGGILGGISTGQDIFFSVTFKPTPTISVKQRAITVEQKEILLSAQGRHDPTVVIRAVPVVQAMAALVVADFMLLR